MDDGKNTKKDTDSRIEENFLHEINVDAVLKETGMNLDELCKLINVDSQSVGRWNKPKAKAGNRPKYNAIVRLLRAGATTKTLFGVDTAASHQPAPEPVSAAPSPEFLKAHPELLEGMREQLLEMGFVSKDQIEDLIRQTIERKSGGKV